MLPPRATPERIRDMPKKAGKSPVFVVVLIAVIALSLGWLLIKGCGGPSRTTNTPEGPLPGLVDAVFISPVTGQRVVLFQSELVNGKRRYKLPEEEDWLESFPENFKDPSSGKVLPLKAYQPAPPDVGFQ